MSQPPHRLAIVTGASSGIGEAVVMELLARGWDVVGVARRPGRITDGRYTHLVFDLADISHLKTALDGKLGSTVTDPSVTRLALVNNAADVALLGQVDQLEPEALLRAFAVNSVAPMLLMGWLVRASPQAVPLRIVNLSSAAAVRPFAGLAAYGATKAALRIAGMDLAAELDASGAARDVTICSFEPGVVDTPMQDAARHASDRTLPIVGMFQGFAATGRLRAPGLPAGEIADFLEGNDPTRFVEQREGLRSTPEQG
jgi:benzil reductase ((S)-benzoin forming)